MVDTFEMVTSDLRNHSNPEECIESDVINFINAGRYIRKINCLRNFLNGCISYGGYDLKTKKSVFVTEFTIPYTQLNAKCAANCQRENTSSDCVIHGKDNVIANIENQMEVLAQIRHTNLIHYECVQCVKKSDAIIVYVVQDFVLGSSIGKLSNKITFSEENSSMVARIVLDVLIFLNSKSLTHGSLGTMVVYIDNLSIIRVTDFGLVPYLHELIGIKRIYTNDLEALGCLVETLLPKPSSVARDFIKNCTSETELVDLQEDRFLQLSRKNVLTPNNEEMNVETPKLNEMGSSITHRSRCYSENIILGKLGHGAFGDVFKVKNKLDNREYAIKRLEIRDQNQYDFITKEVQLLSGLNHKNIVRYNTSWIEDKSADTHGSKHKFQYMYIQMEYCDGRTLRDLISRDIYDVVRLWRHFREIVEGVTYIHEQGLIHRDLKPENIFIDSNDQIKIGDFGLATIFCSPQEYKEQTLLKPSVEINASLTNFIGTALYSAPETNNSKYNQKADLYCHLKFYLRLFKIF